MTKPSQKYPIVDAPLTSWYCRQDKRIPPEHDKCYSGDNPSIVVGTKDGRKVRLRYICDCPCHKQRPKV